MINLQTNSADWPSVVMIHGLLESGKSTLAEFFIRDHGYIRLKFAGPLKNMVRLVLTANGVPKDKIEDYVEGALKKAPIPEMNDPERPDRHLENLSDDVIFQLVRGLLRDAGMTTEEIDRTMVKENWINPIPALQGVTTVSHLLSTLYEWSRVMLKGEVTTVRRMMQTLGEEWRNLHSRFLWVNIVLAQTEVLTKAGSRVVIDDNRYKFEFEPFTHFLPYRFVITRGNKHFLPITDDIHPGERPMPIEWFDAHLQNEGSVEVLHRAAHRCLDIAASARIATKKALIDDQFDNAELLRVAKALIADVRRRYPGEDLYCPHMRKLDQAVARVMAS